MNQSSILELDELSSMWSRDSYINVQGLPRGLAHFMEHALLRAVSDLRRMRVHVVNQLKNGWLGRWMKHAGYMSLQTIQRTRRTGTNCL